MPTLYFKKVHRTPTRSIHSSTGRSHKEIFSIFPEHCHPQLFLLAGGHVKISLYILFFSFYILAQIIIIVITTNIEINFIVIIINLCIITTIKIMVVIVISIFIMQLKIIIIN